MKDFQPGLWYLRDMAKIPAYYFLLILGSLFVDSGVGLITNSTRNGSESVGFGFVTFGIITLVLLSIIQGKFLLQEQCFLKIRFLTKCISLKRTILDALIFQYYFISYAVLFGAYAFLLYFKNGEPMYSQNWIAYFVIIPMFFVIFHNNVGRFMRWVFALLPLIGTIVFLCLIIAR
jgi:hypothetical protein